MKNFAHFSILLFGISAVCAHALPVYRSIGKYGEPRYSQLPPDGQYQVLNFYEPKSTVSKTNSTDKQKQCQILRDNLNALNAGGVINEVDAQGNQRELSAQEAEIRKTQTQNALKEYCQP